MILDKEVNRVFGFSPNTNIYGGYLICDSCKGYYKLKYNESADDFLRCECGGALRYRQNIDNLLKAPQILDTYEDIQIHDEMDEYDEYKGLQQIVDFLRIKATQRKKFLEELHRRVIEQEELLNEIKNESYAKIKSENTSLQEILEEKNINNDISGQKKVIGNIIDNEDRFLSLLHEKRNKKSSASGKAYLHTLTNIRIVAPLIIAVSIIFLYILK